jgi:RNA polymerase sigma factor (sigma-70 family)
MEPYINESDTRELQNDGEIWCIFKKGNKQAFALLYRRYFKMLFQYGIKMAEDKDLVKDCIHDLFIDLWKNKENLTDPKSVKAYLLSAIQHKLIRQLTRVRTRQNEMTRMTFPVIVDCKEDQMIADQIHLEQNYVVNKALSALTKRQQEAIHLKFYSDLSYKEVAAMMSINVDSIYNLISKAIDSMQHELNKDAVQKL